MGFILSAPPEVQQNATPYVTVASLAFLQIPAPLPKLNATSISQAPQLQDESGLTSTSKGAASATSSDAPPLAAARSETGPPHENRH